MEATAKLITGIAALLAAIAWPVVFVVVVLFFGDEIRGALRKMPDVLGRLKKASLLGMSLELDRIADAAMGDGSIARGEVTVNQIEAAARIEVISKGADRDLLTQELDRLTIEYDSIRRTLPSGNVRTLAMTRVVVKMRSLAPALLDHMFVYMGSGSPGGRLAAIAMMQMRPKVADLAWLLERFRLEQPFIFYHAALALQNAATADDASVREMVAQTATKALGTLRAFSGQPDQNTIDILQPLSRR